MHNLANHLVMPYTLFDLVSLKTPCLAEEVDAHFKPRGERREIFPGERLDVLDYDTATGLYVLEDSQGNFYHVADSYVA